jgi:hypothetical protein
MAELAPGLYVSSWMDGGAAYVIREPFPDAPGGSGIGGTGRSLALSEADWERIAPAERERILDLYTRRSADWGVNELQRWLATELNQTQPRGRGGPDA